MGELTVVQRVAVIITQKLWPDAGFWVQGQDMRSMERNMILNLISPGTPAVLALHHSLYSLSLPEVKTKEIRTSRVAKKEESSAKDHKLLRKSVEGTQS